MRSYGTGEPKVTEEIGAGSLWMLNKCTERNASDLRVSNLVSEKICGLLE